MTAAPGHVPLAVVAAAVLFVAWRLYARVRRFVGRQRLSPPRAWISVVLFSLLVVTLLARSWVHPGRALAELAGVAVGIALAVYGLRLTKFEPTPAGLYYTPNAHIGIALSLLLVARVVYRLIQSYVSTAAFTAPPSDTLVRSPLTLFIIGTLAGYYACYALGLLRRRRALGADAQQATPGR